VASQSFGCGEAAVREDNSDLVEGDASHEFLESLPSLGGTGGTAQIGVDKLDRVGTPTALKSPLLESVLKVTTLLVRQSLVWAGLTNVDEGLSVQMKGHDEFGNAHG
jgi:hypothetical protein